MMGTIKKRPPDATCATERTNHERQHGHLRNQVEDEKLSVYFESWMTYGEGTAETKKSSVCF